MMNIRYFRSMVAVSILVLSANAFAEVAGLTFSAGPTWRAKVKMDVDPPPGATGRFYDRIPRNMLPSELDELDPLVKVTDPESGISCGTAERWAATANRTDAYAMSSSDSDSALGMFMQVGYDFWGNEWLSVGIGLRFASYWNIRSSGLGSRAVTDCYKDYFLFSTDPCSVDHDDWRDDLDNATAIADSTASYSEHMPSEPLVCVPARIKADLYQVGLGPRACCHLLEWLDMYGEIDVLCNLSHCRYEYGNASTTDAECLVGVGGNVGMSVNLTDSIGIFGQVGYEWIDKCDASVAGSRAEIDYSSLVVSVGIQFRF